VVKEEKKAGKVVVSDPALGLLGGIVILLIISIIIGKNEKCN
jgi:hypothetical protein